MKYHSNDSVKVIAATQVEILLDINITPRVAQELAVELSLRLDWLVGVYEKGGVMFSTHPEIHRCRSLLRKVKTCTERTTTIKLKRADAGDLLGYMGETGRGMPNGSLWTALQNVMEGIECQL